MTSTHRTKQRVSKHFSGPLRQVMSLGGHLWNASWACKCSSYLFEWGNIKFSKTVHQTYDYISYLKSPMTSDPTRSHSFQWRAGNFQWHERQQPLATGWGVSSDTTKFRILQLYANEEWLSGATANRKEDGSTFFPIKNYTSDMSWVFYIFVHIHQ